MMRLAWCGPWNSRSAIATFGHFIVTELLARHHEVTVFRSEVGQALNEEALPTLARVENLRTTNVPTLSHSFDGVIANIGDHYPFHGSIIDLLGHCPCLAIFHDGLIANLAATWAYDVAAGESSLRELAQQLYGDAAWKEGKPYWDWGQIELQVSARPMTEWLTPLVAGIVTHSEFWAPRMRAACSGKVDVVPLAFPDFKVPPPRKRGEKLVVATIGHINPNKRADQVLAAIASDPILRARCEYWLLGPIDETERKRLVRLSSDLGISPPRFTGWLSDAELRAEMSEVDVISCLRYPLLEAGSASLVTAMYAARPTLVSWHGVYAEVPDDAVLPCTPGQEATDVATHLRAILADPSAGLAMGQRARAHALEFHSAAYYVDRLLPAVVAATEVAPAIGAACRLGKLLGNFGIGPNDPAVSRIVRNLSETLAI
jgi:glycosyltransferase involved in cell wall biosynthesis